MSNGLVCVHDELDTVMDMIGVTWCEDDGCLSCQGPACLDDEHRQEEDHEVKFPTPSMCFSPAPGSTMPSDGVAQLLRQNSNQASTCFIFPDVISSSSNGKEIDVRGQGEVIASITHMEPAAVRDPELLQLQADAEWASDVEMRLRESHGVAGESEGMIPEPVWLLQYGSHPHEFKEALLDGVALRACRDALTAAHRCCILPDSGAKVFIKPEQWDIVMSSLSGLARPLRPYHVIVAAEYEHLVQESLLDICCRRRPKLKQPEHVGRSLLRPTSQSAESAVDDVCATRIAVLTPLRTFLCCVPVLRSKDSVCQSTVSNYRATTNPRRFDFVD